MRTNQNLNWTAIIIAILACLCLLYVVKSGSCTKQVLQQEEAQQYDPIAVSEEDIFLASRDYGISLKPNDRRIAEYTKVLDHLNTKFVESRKDIAQLTDTTRVFLDSYGIKITNLDLARAIDEIFSKPLNNQSFVEYVSSYAAYRYVKKASHAETIKVMKDAFDLLWKMSFQDDTDTRTKPGQMRG